MKTLDLIVYGGLACAAAAAYLYPLLKSWMPSFSVGDTTSDDWRQPWVASLMDLRADLDSAGNDTASETCRQLIMEIVSDGPISRPQKAK
jgi:hypothetical protein